MKAFYCVINEKYFKSRFWIHALWLFVEWEQKFQLFLLFVQNIWWTVWYFLTVIDDVTWTMIFYETSEREPESISSLLLLLISIFVAFLRFKLTSNGRDCNRCLLTFCIYFIAGINEYSSISMPIKARNKNRGLSSTKTAWILFENFFITCF